MQLLRRACVAGGEDLCTDVGTVRPCRLLARGAGSTPGLPRVQAEAREYPWAGTCACGDRESPSAVAGPFAGGGTTCGSRGDEYSPASGVGEHGGRVCAERGTKCNGAWGRGVRDSSTWAGCSPDPTVLVAATKAEEGDDSDREHAQARGARQAVQVGVFIGVVGRRWGTVGGVCMCRDRAGAWIVCLGCQYACLPCSVQALLVAAPAAACVVPALGQASALIAVCMA